MADANESLLEPMGIYFELSGSEAAAAALLGASINYPMRGAVTWKSVVGTNVASDALSHVASGRRASAAALIVIGEDYGEGASILQGAHALRGAEVVRSRCSTRATACSPFARFVEEGFGLSEACNEPVLLLDPRSAPATCAARSSARTTCAPAISRLSPLTRAVASASSGSTCRRSPTRWRRKKFTERLPRRAPVHRRARASTSTSPGSGVAPRDRDAGRPVERRWRAASACSAWPTSTDARRCRCSSSTRCTRWCLEELIALPARQARVLVVEEGMPNYIERELKALAHEARLDVEIHGKELLSPHGEYVPALVHRRAAQVPRRWRRPAASRSTAIEDALSPRSPAHQARARGPARSRCDKRRRRSAPAAPSARCSAR